MRNLPNIELDEREGYAKCLAAGYDALTETFKLILSDDLKERLYRQKEKAQELSKNTKTELYTVDFGGLAMQMSSSGGKGVTFWLKSVNFDILIRVGLDWNFSVKYSAVGMWCDGLQNIRQDARQVLMNECAPACDIDQIKDNSNWVTVSKFDYAFDLYSPEFTKEMKPEILYRFLASNSKVKKMSTFKADCVGRGVYLETITMGNKSNLQMTVYDKGKEIREKSGKEWMAILWANNGYEMPADGKIENVWRVECRFGKKFLKNRKVQTFEDIEKILPELLAEALFTRRLTTDTGDSNKSRWDLHPLFCEAYGNSLCADEFAPLGSIISMSGDKLYETLEKSAAGIIRTMGVIKDGDYDWMTNFNITQHLHETIEEDPDHERKVERTIERYKNIHVGQ